MTCAPPLSASAVVMEPWPRASRGQALVQRRSASAARRALLSVCLVVIAALHMGTASEVVAPHVGMVSTSFLGHVVPLLRLASELQSRGHRVSFVAFEESRQLVEEFGVRFVSAGACPLPAAVLSERLAAISREASSFRSILSTFNELYLPISVDLFDAILPHFRADAPDLLVMDIAMVGVHDLAEVLNVPLVLNSPTAVFDLQTHSALPSWGTGFSKDMRLWDKCMNVLFPRLLSVALTPSFMLLNKKRWERGLAPFDAQEAIFRGKLVLQNTVPGLEYAEKLSPLTVQTGPMLPRGVIGDALSRVPGAASAAADRREASRLPMPLEAFFSDGAAPVVVVDLGSMPKVDTRTAAALTKGLVEEAGCKLLWLVPEAQRGALAHLSSPRVAIKVKGKLPHLRILSLPQVRFVVSHCGAAAAGEALSFAKPLLCVPFFVDQSDTAVRVRDAGAGLVVDKIRADARDAGSKARRLLEDLSFARAAAHIAGRSQFAGGVDAAADAVEGAVASGYAHLTPFGIDQPWHRRRLLDAYAVLSGVLSLAFVFLYGCLLVLYFGVMFFARLVRASRPSVEVLRGGVLGKAVGRGRAAAAVESAADGSRVERDVQGVPDLYPEAEALGRKRPVTNGILAVAKAAAQSPEMAALMTSVAVTEAAASAPEQPGSSASRVNGERLPEATRELTNRRRAVRRRSASE